MTNAIQIDPKLTMVSVLLVEDDAFALRMAQSVLKQLGVVHIKIARDGVEALNVLRTEAGKIDLIISDWNMPKMSGLELLRTVRAFRPDMPFIMLTGKTSPEFVLDAKDNGVNGYVVKPFSPDQLYKRLIAVVKAMKQG
jgi:two-component system chemotaxis response regulator CheY